MSHAAKHGRPVVNLSYLHVLHTVRFLCVLVSEFTELLMLTRLFLCSLENVSGSENITQILDALLNGYDNRLRPGSGGNSERT